LAVPAERDCLAVLQRFCLRKPHPLASAVVLLSLRGLARNLCRPIAETMPDVEIRRSEDGVLWITIASEKFTKTCISAHDQMLAIV
jgi:hypothetical protein